MNEVEGMDLSERAHLHSPPSALRQNPEELNVDQNITNLQSPCAILKSDSNKGALMLIENDECEGSNINRTFEPKSDENNDELDQCEKLSNNPVKEDHQLENGKITEWKYRVCPTSVDDQLENSGSELQLLSHCSSSAATCSTVKNYARSKNVEFEKNGMRSSSQTYFECNGENEVSKIPVSVCEGIYPTETESRLSPPADNQSENFKLGETSAENSEGEVERSDGSDSGLGSELSDERTILGSDAKEIDAGIGCESEIVQDDQGTTDIDVPERCDGSDSGLGSEMAEETCQLEGKASAQLQLDTDSCLEVDEDKSDFQIEAPALDDLKTPSFEEIRSPCPSFDDIKDTSEPLRTPQPNLDFPGCPLDKPPEAKVVEPLKTFASRPAKSNLKRKSSDSEVEVAPKKKRSISFNTVSVYYFPRAQGFTCVPSQGGSTLGMASVHSHVQQFTLTEHAMEQRRLHRLMLQRLRNERLQPPSDTDDSESEEEPTDDEEDELDLDSYYFLQVRVAAAHLSNARA